MCGCQLKNGMTNQKQQGQTTAAEGKDKGFSPLSGLKGDTQHRFCFQSGIRRPVLIRNRTDMNSTDEVLNFTSGLR